jgi:YVTN family beta-propeller protein
MTAPERMADRLTLPFRRGADRLPLTLLPVPANPARVTVAPYDFARHTAEFGAVPVPRYLLSTMDDLTRPVTVTVAYRTGAGAARTRTVTFPAGTLAGASVLLDLGADDVPATRLTSLTAVAPVAGRWRLLALLGTTARLLWVAGAARDELRTQAARVRELTRLPAATGRTLDLIGFDLGVPRFPPLPYGFEDGTVALYHFEDTTADTVADVMPLYGGVGHPGDVDAATIGAVGRFGRGVAFETAGAEIRVDHHDEFALPPAVSFTAECFVRPVGAGVVLNKLTGQRGWALDIGEFGRGLPRNVQFLLGDGTVTVALFADLSLPTDRFSHLAGVLDRAASQALLYVDGVPVASRPLGTLGDLTNTERIRMGSGLRGSIDEVRLSRAARIGFHPVLGESDDGYRGRLRIFQRWRLPTVDELEAALNEAVGPVNGVERPLVLDDTDATLAAGALAVRVTPNQVSGSIDDSGRRDTTEEEVNGTAAEDPGFDPDLLVDGADPRAAFANSSRMRVGTRKALRALLDLLAGTPGVLIVADGPDGLFTVGRKLELGHVSVPAPQLGARAHRAGFTWVRVAGGRVFASVRSTQTLDIELAGGTATPEHGFDLLAGQTLVLRVVPALPVRAQVRWYVIGTRARVTGRTDEATASLVATRPGELVVGVQVVIGSRSFHTTRRFRVGIAALNAGESIGDEVVLDADFFDPAYLVVVTDPRATYAPAARRMNVGVAERFDRLLDLINLGDANAGLVLVAAAWLPSGTGPETEGRVLVLERGTLTSTLERLGALAHAAGFTHVARDGNRLRITQSAGDPVLVTGPESVVEGQPGAALRLEQSAQPEAAVAAGPLLFTANLGTDTVSAIDTVTGRVLRVTKTGVRPRVIAISPDRARVFTGDTGGTVTVIDAATGAVVRSATMAASPTTLAHHPTQQRLYIGLGNDTVIQVNPNNFTAIGTPLALGTRPVALAVQPDGARLWIAGADGVVRVVNAQTLAAITTVTQTGEPVDLAVTASRAYLLVNVGAFSGSLRVLTVPTPGIEATRDDFGARPRKLAVSAERVFVICDDTRLHLRKPDGTAETVVRLDRETAAVAADTRAYVAFGGKDDGVGVVDGGALTQTWPLGTGHGERIFWTVLQAGGARAQLSSSTRREVVLVPESAGPLRIEAGYQWPDHTPPYTFIVRLAPELAGTEVVIRKDQYDLIMNVLSELHPVGVEVDTSIVREHVVEIRESLMDVFPGHTFPDFRIPGGR